VSFPLTGIPNAAGFIIARGEGNWTSGQEWPFNITQIPVYADELSSLLRMGAGLVGISRAR
jgi:hypothetical protein